MAWFRDDERGLAMSIRQTAIPLGGGLGALILPRLAASHGFATVYAVLAAMCAVSAAFTWRWLHEPPFAGAAASGVPSTSQTEPLRDAQIWRVVWGIGILCAPMFAVVTFATVFLHDLAHLGIGAISGTMVVLQLGAMVMRVWSGLSTDRRGNRRAYLRGSTLCFRSRCGSKPECMNLIWPARDRLVSLNMTVDLAEASFEIPFIDLGAAYRTFLIEGV
jgi:predicted MFS family arabinose efflux permease